MKTLYNELAELTADAYSADRYGANEWAGIAMGLLETGYSPKETEVVLRSKWMRWAGDACLVSDNPENPTAGDALAYVEANKNSIRKMIDNEIVD